jgi:hypothetical protein
MKFLSTILILLSTTIMVSAKKGGSSDCDKCNVNGQIKCGTTGGGEKTAVVCKDGCWTYVIHDKWLRVMNANVDVQAR